MQQRSDTPSETLTLDPGEHLDAILSPGDRLTVVSGRLWIGPGVGSKWPVFGIGVARGDVFVANCVRHADLRNDTKGPLIVRWTRMGAAYGDLMRGGKR